MKPALLSTLILLFFLSVAEAQEHKGKLKVFIDCSNTFCDQTFIRSEINMVDFLLDRVAADVHVLITSQNTGSGGDQFQLLFIGQHAFTNHRDTLQPKVINGASDFLVEVFGEKGKHARSAVGTNALPMNISVEIEMIVEVEN